MMRWSRLLAKLTNWQKRSTRPRGGRRNRPDATRELQPSPRLFLNARLRLISRATDGKSSSVSFLRILPLVPAVLADEQGMHEERDPQSPGTCMFLIAPWTRAWQAGKVPAAKQRREKQTRRVISQRRFRRRKRGMNTTQASGTSSSIFIGRWTPKILFSLRNRPYRHGQLRRQLGRVSQRMLTRTLRNLESAGLVARRVAQQKPAAVEYSLTEPGRTVIAPLRGMCRWAKQYRKDVSADVRLPGSKTG
jgi:DNA-binding HxlR family transcriptional regulator